MAAANFESGEHSENDSICKIEKKEATFDNLN